MKTKKIHHAYFVSTYDGKRWRMFYSFKEALNYAMTNEDCDWSLIRKCGGGAEAQVWSRIDDKNNSLELPF